MTSYTDLSQLVNDICGAYCRKLFSNDYETFCTYETTCDFCRCLESTQYECLLFFIKDVDEYGNGEYYLCYFYSVEVEDENGNKVKSFETSDSDHGIIGVITSSNGSYTFSSNSDYGLGLAYSYEYETEYYKWDIYDFTITKIDSTPKTFKLQYNVSGNAVDINFPDQRSIYAVLDPATCFSNATLTTDYFYTPYDGTPVVVTSDLYDKKDTEYTKLYKAVGEGIPIDNVTQFPHFTALLGIIDNRTDGNNKPLGTYPVYMEITSTSSDTWNGEMCTYGNSLKQTVSLNVTSNTIEFTPINGAYSTGKYSYVVYAIFLETGLVNKSGNVMDLVYPVKKPVKGTKYWYPSRSSLRFRDINENYRQFDYLYNLSGNEEILDKDTPTGYLAWADGTGSEATTLYRYCDTVSCVYNNDTGTDQINILENDVNDMNIRYISENENYGFLPIDYSSDVIEANKYFDRVYSDLNFTYDKRYPDLKYYIGTTNNIVCDSSANTISVKGGNTPWLCGLEQRDFFVSYCFQQKQGIPQITGSNSYMKPAYFGGTPITPVNGWKLEAYGDDYIDDDTIDATKLYGVGKYDIEEYLKRDTYQDTVIYIEIKIDNLDACTDSNSPTGNTVYFDTDATFGKKFYIYLLVDGSRANTSNNTVPLRLYYNKDDESGEYLYNEFTMTVNMEYTTSFTLENSNGFSIKFDSQGYGIYHITAIKPQLFFPANMRANPLIGSGYVANEIQSFTIMAVYNRTTPSVISKIRMYTNAYYLREDEYEETDYAQNLLQSIIFGANKSILTDIPEDWTVFKRIFISFVYYDSEHPISKRQFTICNEIKKEKDKDNNDVYKAKALCMYRFSNRGTQLVLCNRVIIDKKVTVTPRGIDFGYVILYRNGEKWEITLDNYWYNYFPTVNHVDILAVIGIS